MGERVADDLRLLVDLLGHEVAIIALLGEQAAGGADDDAPLDRLAVDIAKFRACASHHDPVAFFEIGDAVGEGGERQRVRAQKHLVVAIADRERRALPGANEQVVLALEEIDQRIGAAHALQRRLHRIRRRLAGRHFVGDQKGRDFRIGLGHEAVALGRQLLAQRLEILDDAVVHHRQPVAGVRMGVGFRRLAVGRPARMADADLARQRRGFEAGFEVLQLALGAHARQRAMLQRRHAGGIIAAIFQSLQRG